MVMRATKAARITGTVTGSDGKPMNPAAVMVTQASGFAFNFIFGGQVRPDGTFIVNGLVPGDYRLIAQRAAPSPDGPEFASTTISVNGEDLADVHLMASRPSAVRGRVIVDPAAAQQLPPVVMLALFPVNLNGGIPVPPPPPARMADDFTFETKAPAERMRFTLGGMGPSPAGWAIRAVRLNGIDVTDGIDFKPNEEVSGLEIELTNKVAIVSGLVTNDRGQPAQQYTAIVFAQDKDKWTPGTRYQGIGRADQDGRFKISGLPSGDYYVIAVDRVEQGQWTDPEYLESIRPNAKSFSLLDGETRTVDLKLTSGT